jgi:hypothetical protein
MPATIPGEGAMLTLAVLLQLCGVIFTFSLGPTGYVLGPLTVIAGGWLYRHEQRRRKELAANPPPPTAAAPAIPRRPGWQRFLIGFGVFVVAFTAIFALVWRLTAGMTEAADAFFAALRDGDVATARTYLAEDFRASTSDEQLLAYVKNSALSEYQSASWSSRGMENSRGNLEGTLETRTGGSIPMKVELVKENGSWKIYTLRKPAAGLQTDDGPIKPSEIEQVRLVRATTEQFAAAIKRGDFAEFHKYVSGLWQRQISADQLQTTFRQFAETGADFSVLNSLQPNIAAAAYDADGAFVIEGTYPSQPSTFSYRYRYIYEGVDWKLAGLNASVR